MNLGTGRGSSVLELIEAAERVSGRPVPYKVGRRRDGDPARLIADPSWHAGNCDVDAILASAWAWHLKDKPVRLKATQATGAPFHR